MEPKKYFYYINDICTGMPRVTVCVLKNSDALSRGVAIFKYIESYEGDWSNQNDFRKKLGRTIAEGRAWKAYNNFKTDEKNRIGNEDADLITPHEFVSKSEWMPALTEYEKSIIK